MKKLIAVMGMLAVMGVSGVAWGMGSIDTSKRIDELENRVKHLELANEEFAEKINTLISHVNILNAYSEQVKQEINQQIGINKHLLDNIFLIQSMLPRNNVISVGEKKYSMIASTGVLMAVSFEDIKSKASGSELTLKFVNCYSITNMDIAIDVVYSKENTDYDENLSSEELTKKFQDNQKYKKTKNEKMKSALPGTATYLKVFLPDYKPEEIKYISISMEAGGMQYKTSTPK